LYARQDHEGHPGWIINETPEHHGVHQAWANAKGLKPNLVLLNVGTNDCSYGLEAGAGDRIEALVRDIFNDVPGVVVILSTLVPSPSIKACAARVSEQYRAAAARLENGRIAVADFNTAMTDAMFSSDDGIHPTDAGYKFMASVWWDAIAKVENAITAPIDTGVDDSKATSSCAKVAGVSRGPIITQRGYGHDDGIYVHKSRGSGVLPSLRFTKPKSEVEADEIPRLIWFAQVTNIDQVDRSKALDDWVGVFLPQHCHILPSNGMLISWYRFASTATRPETRRTSTGSERTAATALSILHTGWTLRRTATTPRVRSSPCSGQVVC
jgi:hypothetical protein